MGLILATCAALGTLCASSSPSKRSMSGWKGAMSSRARNGDGPTWKPSAKPSGRVARGEIGFQPVGQEQQPRIFHHREHRGHREEEIS